METLTFTTLLLALHFCPLHAVYFLYSDGWNPRTLVRSTDGGTTWSSPVDFMRGYEAEEISCLSNDVCLIGAVDAYKNFTVLLTKDGGRSWKNLTESRFPGKTKEYQLINSGFYCIDENTCLFGHDNTIIRTTDQFQTYETVLTTPEKAGQYEMDINDIDCVRNGTICIAVGGIASDGIIYRSTDSGKTWSLVTHGQNSSELYRELSCVSTPNGDNFCMAVGGASSIHVSVDDGQTWKYLVKSFESDKYFTPKCAQNPCTMATKVDMVACLEPYHCAVTFRGYEMGIDPAKRKIQNGALCSVIKYKGKTATVRCTPLDINDRRASVHCSSPTSCLAFATDHFEEGHYEYMASLYAFDYKSRTWSRSQADLNLDKFGADNMVFGNRFIYPKNFDFVSNGGGLDGGDEDNSGHQISSNIAIIVSTAVSLYYLLV